MSVEQISAKMDLPPVTHVGVVVKDVCQAVDYYSRIFGLGPFEPVYDFSPDKYWYKGEKSQLSLKVSRTVWGEMEFELIQPLAGKSVLHDHLNTRGEGLHHLGIDVENYDDIVRRMNEEGFKALLAIETYLPKKESLSKASYFDTDKIGGVIMEVIWRPWLYKNEKK